MIEPMGFIQSLKTSILERMNVNPYWAEFQGIHLIASIMGSQRTVPNIIGNVPLNTYCLNIGGSGVAIKSTPMKNFTRPILTKLEENIELTLKLPSRFTVESMIKFITSEGNEYTNSGSIMRDEFSSLLKETRHKDYNADLLEFISECYDGVIEKRFTIKHGLQAETYIYCCLLGSTTEHFFQKVDKSFFIQGTGYRINYIKSDPVDQTIVDPNDFFNNDLDTRTQIINDLAERLGELHDRTPNNFIVAPAARRVLNDYRNERKKLSKRIYEKDTKDITYSYIDREPEKAIRLAGIHAVSRMENTIIQDDNQVEQVLVEEVDAKIAVERMRKYYEYFTDLVSVWIQVSQIEKPVYNMDQYFKTVITNIQKVGGEIKGTDLVRACHFESATFRNVVNAMVDMKMIYAYEKRIGKRGIKTTIYSLKKNTPIDENTEN